MRIARPTMSGGGAEVRAPERVADHRAAWRARDFVGGLEQPPARRRDAEHLEELRGDAMALHARRAVAVREVRVPPLERRHAIERSLISPKRRTVGSREGGPFEVVRGGDGFARERIGLGVLREHHEAIDVADRERVEEQRVHHAEDGGVRAEAEREREDDDQRHARLAQERARGELHLVPGGTHACVSSGSERRRARAQQPPAVMSTGGSGSGARPRGGTTSAHGGRRAPRRSRRTPRADRRARPHATPDRR